MNREHIYLINPAPDYFRWVVVKEDGEDWGLQLARLKGAAAGIGFGPIPVEWASETIDRPIADFSNFRSNVLCISSGARNVLASLLSPYGEWIALNGLEGQFSSFHCLQIVDAVNHERTDALLTQSIHGSFHSPRFTPTLQATKLVAADIFRVPESISKLFVSGNFRSIYEQYNLSGLEFFEVELTED